MATATTSIEITAKDSTAAAFASANSNLSRLASSAATLTTSLSAIGATAVIGSMAAFTKQTLQAQDELFKLSQKTGIAVESLAGLEFAAEQSGVELEKVAKATRAFSLLVAESADATSGAAKKLGQLGLSYRDLKDLSPEKQLLALSDALSKFSKEDRAVALTSLLGNKMADLIPLLSGGSKGLQELIDQGRKLNPVTEQSAKNAEKFNDQINLLNKSVSALGREMVQGIIPGLARVSDEMVRATQQGGLLSGVLAGVKQLFVESFGNPKILGDVGQIRREILKTQESIEKLESRKDSIFFDKNALLHEQEKLAQLNIDLQKAIDKSRETIAVNESAAQAQKKFAVAIEETGTSSGKTSQKVDKMTAAMKDQSRISSEYVKLLKIERQQREEMLLPYQRSAQVAQDRLDDMRQENRALELSRARQISLEQAIELTTIARLEERKAISKDTGAVAAIDKEIAARREMVQLINERDAKSTGDKIRSQELQSYEQFSIQAARNIQTNLAFGIEQGFRNGFKSGVSGLLDGLINTVSSVISQIVSIKLLNAVGAGSFLGGGGSALNALSIGGNVGSLGGMFRGGFGSVGLLSSAGRLLPGAAGSFFGGMGGASAGIFSAAGGAGTSFIGGAGTALGGSGMGAAASMGSTFAAAAGPAMALFAVDAIGRMLAGDKKLGGAEYIPVIGGFLAAMFGRGPYKFRQQTLQGTVSSGGFDGDITNIYRSKGGLFVGNKHKSISEQFTPEMQALFDDTIGSFFKIARDAGETLKLDISAVDGFVKEIQIKSKKGEKLTEEAITEMLKGISDDIAKAALPMVDELKKSGETSMQVLSRLSIEYLGLVDTATNVLGRSLEDARNFIQGIKFEDRTAFVDAIGGIDALNQKTSFFAQNFLTEQERLIPVQQRVNEELTKIGVSTSITRDQFKELVQSFGTVNGITKETLISLLDLAPAFATVISAAEAATAAIDPLAVALERLGSPQKLVNAINNGGQVTLGGGDGIMVSNAAPNIIDYQTIFSREQGKLVEAVTKANQAYDAATKPLIDMQKNLRDLISTIDSLRNSIDLGKQSGLAPAEKLSAARAALGTATQENIGDRVSNYLDLAKGQSGSRLDYLRQVGFVKSTLDSLSQSASGNISGIDSSIGRLASYRDSRVESAIKDTGYITRLFQAMGSDVDISDLPDILSPYFNLIFSGLSKMSLPKFASGTDYVPHDMAAIIHQGERITPAAYNRSDATNAQLVAEMKANRAEMSAMRKSMQDMEKFWRQLTRDGQSIVTVAA